MDVSSLFRAVLRRLLAALGQIFSRSFVLMDGVFYSEHGLSQGLLCFTRDHSPTWRSGIWRGWGWGTSSEMIGKGGPGASGPSPMEQHLGPGPPQARVQHSPQT